MNCLSSAFLPVSLSALLLAAAPLHGQAPAPVIAPDPAPVLPPVIQISEPTVEFLDMQGCTISDAARMLTVLSGRTVVSTESARVKSVDALIDNLPLESALKVICRSSGLVYRYDETSRLYTILGLDEYQRTSMEETKNIFETRTFKVGTANLNQIASSIVQLYGSRVIITSGMPIEDFREAPGNTYSTSSYNNRGQRINNGNIGRTGASGNRTYYSSYGGGAYDYDYGYGVGYGYSYSPYNSPRYYNNPSVYNGYNFAANSGMYGGFGPGAYGNYPYQSSLNSRFGMAPNQVTTEEGVPAVIMNAESVLAKEAVRSATTRPTTRTEALEQAAQKTGQPLIYVSTSYEHSYLLVRTADHDALEELGRLIEQLDEVVPQVVLEMKILQLDVGDGFTGSASFKLNSQNEQFAPNARDATTGAVTGQEFVGFENAFNVGNFASEAAATFAYQYLSDQITARVELLASDNRVEVIATPLLIATNNRSAQIEVGEERIMTVGGSSQVVNVPGPTLGTTVQKEYIQTDTEKRTIGLVLDILPRINEDGTVTLSVVQESTTLKPKNNSIQVGTQIIPIDSVDTANVDATVVAKDNCTIAVGGLIRTENSIARGKVPVLGDIPLLGLPFKRKQKAAKKTELVLLITPHILHGKGRGEDTEVTRKLMRRLSDHRYHVGGEEIIEESIPQLRKYRGEATSSYQDLNHTETVPEKTEYWGKLGSREAPHARYVTPAPPVEAPAPVLVPAMPAPAPAAAPASPAPVAPPPSEPQKKRGFFNLFRKSAPAS